VADPVFFKLQQLLRQENVGANEYASVIESDPMLASKLLSLAHSAKYAGASFATIPELITIVGLSEIRRVAILPAIKKAFKQTLPNFDHNLFFFRGILVARTVETIVAQYRPLTGIEYIAGLLHDVGKLILAANCPTEFTEIQARHKIEGGSLYSIEKEMLGFSHTNLSALFCAYWGITNKVCTALNFHHEPASIHDCESPMFLAGIIYLAEQLASLCGHGRLENEARTTQELLAQPAMAWIHDLPAPNRTLNIDMPANLKFAKEVVAMLGHA